MPILWRESMALGQATIDSEHKYLFCLINAVELALQIDNAREVISFYVEQLHEYTRAHFIHEEKIQLKIKYPHYVEHKAEHQEILDALEKLQQRLKEPEQKTDSTPPKSGEAHTNVRATPEIEDYDPTASENVDSKQPTANSTQAADQPRADKTLEEVVQFLRHWILDHVLKADMRMKPFLQAYASGKRPPVA